MSLFPTGMRLPQRRTYLMPHACYEDIILLLSLTSRTNFMKGNLWRLVAGERSYPYGVGRLVDLVPGSVHPFFLGIARHVNLHPLVKGPLPSIRRIFLS